VFRSAVAAFVAASLAVALAPGCLAERRTWKPGEPTAETLVYLVTADMGYLVPVTVPLPRAGREREAARLVVEWEAGGPLRSPFPGGCILRSFRVEGATAHVEVSGRNGAHPDSPAPRAADALAWTLTEFPGVTRVSLDAWGARTGPAPRPPFLNRDGPAPWDCSMKLVLWFGYRGYSVPVTRFVPRTVFPHWSAVEQLALGPPGGSPFERPLPEGVEILGVRVEGGVCTVNVSTGTDPRSAAGLSVRSVVLTLTEFLDVRAVRILVNGRSGIPLQGAVSGEPLGRGRINPVSVGLH
jgi:spore germination protein GerM